MKVRNIAGSIFVRKTSNNKEKLYITYKGKQIATGLANTEYGRSEAKKILKQINEEDRNNKFNLVPEKQTLMLYDAFEKFMMEKKRSRDKKTLEWYYCSFKAFFPQDFPVNNAEKRNNVGISWIELQMQEIITSQSKTSSTLSIYLRGVGVFVNWLYEERYLQYPVRISRLKKMIKNAPKKPIRVYNDDEITAICEALRQDVHYEQLAYCIEIMVATGMRIHEVLELSWQHIKKDFLEIESKDKRSIQLIPRTETLNEILSKIPRKPLQKKVFKWSEESDSRLRQALYKAMQTANIERDGRSFHEFRKTFITRLIVRNKKMNIFDIANAARCEIRIIQQHYLKYPSEQLEALLNP